MLLSLRVRLAEARTATESLLISSSSPPKLSSPDICRAFAEAEIQRLFKNEDVVRLWKPIRKMVSKLNSDELVDELQHRDLKSYGPNGALQQRLNAAIHREINELSSQLERAKQRHEQDAVRLIQIQLQLSVRSRKELKSIARKMSAPSTLVENDPHKNLRSWIAGMSLEREKMMNTATRLSSKSNNTSSPTATPSKPTSTTSWRLSDMKTLRDRYKGFSSVALMNIVELKQASGKLFQEMEEISSSADVVNHIRLELLKIKRNEIWKTLRDRVREKHNDAEAPERRISDTIIFPVMSLPDPVRQILMP